MSIRGAPGYSMYFAVSAAVSFPRAANDVKGHVDGPRRSGGDDDAAVIHESFFGKDLRFRRHLAHRSTSHDALLRKSVQQSAFREQQRSGAMESVSSALLEQLRIHSRRVSLHLLSRSVPPGTTRICTGGLVGDVVRGIDAETVAGKDGAGLFRYRENIEAIEPCSWLRKKLRRGPLKSRLPLH